MIQSSSLTRPERRDAQPRHALLEKGFRPFFLMAALHAALTLPLWLLQLGGAAQLGLHFGAPFWHAHEMVFGFTVAVVAGFLLTAIGNWTGRETVTQAPLAGLAALWLAGRVAVLFGVGVWVAIVDLAFLPALAVACLRPLLAADNRRNYAFVVMLVALFGANAWMHRAALLGGGGLREGAALGVGVLVLMIVVMTARVVPMFTRNATGQTWIRSLPRWDRSAALGVVAFVALEAFGVRGPALAAVAAGAAVFVIGRTRYWGTRHTLREPLLWVLHAGHAFIALGLALRAAAELTGSIPASMALHASTVGGIGLVTLGMMARVSLGHTGRMLAAPSSAAAAFMLLLIASVVRVVGPLLGADAYVASMMISGTGFAAAFALFVVAYVPMLLAPRVDGRPG